MPLIPALRRLRQEDLKFETRLGLKKIKESYMEAVCGFSYPRGKMNCHRKK
jgi:hypothetical protein